MLAKCSKRSDITSSGRVHPNTGPAARRSWCGGRTIGPAKRRARRGIQAGVLPDLALLSLLCAAALALSLALRRLERRLPAWLARRAGGGATPPPAAVLVWRRPVVLGLWAPRLALWLALALVASDRLPRLMSARDDLAGAVSSGLMEPLLRSGERAFSALELLELPLLFALLWLAVTLLMRGVRAQLARAGAPTQGGSESFIALLRYALLGVGALLVLQLRGFDLGSLAVFGGVLGVGIGFGLQNIARNFVSGVLLGFERPIAPGDYVSLGELSGTVRRIGARATEILTPDHVSILVPNSRFLEQEVVNWSHGDPLCKLHAPVGVAYGSDVAKVRAALLEAAHGHPKLLSDPRPTVDLEGFGESALRFDLEVWTREPQAQNELRSSLNYRIEASLRRHGIEVPFPQLDLRLRPPAAPRAELRPAPASESAPEAEPDASPEFWSDARIAALAARLRGPGGVAVADRRHRLSLHRRCCVGSEIVGWLVEHESLSRREAVAAGRRMLEQGLLRHVLDEHGFEDAYLFYRFAADEAAAA
jgi:small-conductance mechanosensitive channel